MRSYNHLHKCSEKSRFRINYGFCASKKEDVSFIPNTTQIHTQDCFKHRRDNG